jgi:hypothetical protein
VSPDKPNVYQGGLGNTDPEGDYYNINYLSTNYDKCHLSLHMLYYFSGKRISSPFYMGNFSKIQF